VSFINVICFFVHITRMRDEFLCCLKEKYFFEIIVLCQAEEWHNLAAFSVSRDNEQPEADVRI